VSATLPDGHNRPRRTGAPGSHRREDGWALRATAGHTENPSQATIGKRPEKLAVQSPQAELTRPFQNG
jgi:hypothetical protein